MVAIVLVNFNGANDTIDCIESLNSLSYKDFKIIVVDNKSTDNSVYTLKEYKKKESFVLLQAKENNGFAAGNNIGIQYALKDPNCEYVWLLNNDTIVTDDSLKELLKGFFADDRVGITTAKIYYEKNRTMIWYAGGSISRKTSRTEHWHYGEVEMNKSMDDKNYQQVSFISGCCMLIKRDVIGSVGKMDERYFLYEEDSDYCLRVADKGYQMVYCPQAVIYHKVNASTGENSGTVQFYSVRNKYRLIKKNFKGLNQASAMEYASLQMWFRCIKHEMDWKYYWKGLSAYFKNKNGKHTFS